MKYGSVCSGIESASVAWEPLGWSAEWFSEVEPFPSAVLAHRWPSVANLGDMTQLPALLRAGLIAAPDILVGGTPCQAFSVAGMRKGLDDERGQLTIKYVEVANEIDKQRPDGSECIAVWENVPGVLSDKSNAFGCFLGALVGEDDPLEPTTERPAVGKSCSLWRWDKKQECHFPRWSNAGIVYGPQRIAAWRILDAQYFGVAQRRRRVFVVASARDGFDPAAVLFESESLRRDTPPSREEGEEIAPTIRSGAPNGSKSHGARSGDSKDELIVPVPYSTSGAGYWREGIGALRGRAQDSHENITVTARHDSSPCPDRGMNVLAMRTANTSANGIGVDEELAYTLDGAQGQAVALMENQRAEIRLSPQTDALTTGSGKPGQGYAATFDPPSATVRRLTPVECERLQGFPDSHTAIPWRKKPPEECPDGPRYKAIGNSKAVPVIKWAGLRIKKHLEEI